MQATAIDCQLLLFPRQFHREQEKVRCKGIGKKFHLQWEFPSVQEIRNMNTCPYL